MKKSQKIGFPAWRAKISDWQTRNAFGRMSD
jgi:hypothetical protein